MEKEELKKGNYIKKLSKFVFEELNMMQCLKAFAQWTQILVLILIYITLLKILAWARIFGDVLLTN